MIVFGDPFSDRRSRLLHAAVLVNPDFFLLQAAMKAFDVAVAFRVMIRRSAVRDAQPCKRFHVTGRSKLRSVVGGQRQLHFAASSRQPRQHRLLDGVDGFFAAATQRKIPSGDFPRAAVDHAHQVRPSHRWSRPHLGHIRLPDLIRLGGFHAAPLFASLGTQPPRPLNFFV